MNEFIILIIFAIILALYLQIRFMTIKKMFGGSTKQVEKNWLKIFINNPNYSIRVDVDKPDIKNVIHVRHYIFHSKKQIKNINYQLDQFNVQPFDIETHSMYITIYKSKESRNINLARLVLCEESLNFCKYQNLDKFKQLYPNSIVKKYADVYHKLSLTDQEKLILISGAIPLLLGIRQATDVDIHTLEIGERLCNKFKKLITDCSYQIDNKVRSIFSSVSVDKVMYVNGLKCYSIENHLDYRLTVRSISKYAELFYISYFMHDIIKDYKIPELKLHDSMAYYKKIEPDGSLYVKEIGEHLYRKFKKLGIRKEETDAYERYEQPTNKKRIAKNIYKFLHTEYDFPKYIRIPMLEEHLN
jgi:hypothetical protein